MKQEISYVCEHCGESWGDPTYIKQCRVCGTDFCQFCGDFGDICAMCAEAEDRKQQANFLYKLEDIVEHVFEGMFLTQEAQKSIYHLVSSQLKHKA